jgi:DNA-binding HxlR family transcriptional regulator
MEDGTSEQPRHTEGTDTLPRPEETATCELRELLDRLGDKWSLLVVEMLGHGVLRFSELKRQIDGISQRMLTLTLRHLERDGLITRTVYPVVPPRVDYELTPLGHSLLDAVQPIVTWSRENRSAVAVARTHFDRHATT